MCRKRYAQAVLIISILIALLSSGACGGGGGESQYSLSISVQPIYGGTVDQSGGQYDKDQRVTITATASEGYVFDGWSGASSSTSEKITITMNSNKLLTAHFISEDTVKLNIHVNPDNGGTVDPSTGYYSRGERLILTAEPAEGYFFDHWEGDASGTAENTYITMDSQKRVVAYFDKKRTLSVDIVPWGGGTTDPSGGAYETGRVLTITAKPSNKYDFDYWSGDGDGSTPSIQVTMDTDKHLIANFTRYALGQTPWPMYRHDVRHTSVSPFEGPNAANLKWRYQTDGSIMSSAAIASDGTIYIGSRDKHLYALNPDGTRAWKYETGASVDASAAIRADGTIYVGSRDNFFYALNPDGYTEWKYQTNAAISSAPVIGTDGTVYFGSNDRYLYALTPEGKLSWQFRTNAYVRSSPAIGEDGTVYFGADDNTLYALNPIGTLKWEFKAGSSIESSPAIGTDGTIFFGSNDGSLYALNPDGTSKWRFLTDNWVTTSPAIGTDGTVFFGSNDKHFYALNPDGTKKWEFETNRAIQSSPVIDADGTIYFGSNDGFIYALNPDGTRKWSYEVTGEIASSPVIDADGTIYVGTSYRYVFALGH